MNTSPNPNSTIKTDALIIGSGPVGLFQAFQLGLLGIQSHIIDALPHAGGQCAVLYPDKFIYDIPAIPRITGLMLTESLLKQISPFSPVFHFKEIVETLEKTQQDLLQIKTSHGKTFICKTVFIAAGIGAFLPKSLKVAGLANVLPEHIHNFAPTGCDLSSFANQHILILGGEEDACAFALRLLDARSALGGHITLIHRRDHLQGEGETIARINAAIKSKALDFIAGQITELHHQNGTLSETVIETCDNKLIIYPCQHLFNLQGLIPKLTIIRQWPLDFDHHQIKVDLATCETSQAGIFAVGDINAYTEKKKLIVCGFHEATQAATQAYTLIHGKKPQLKYTTSNSELKAVLEKNI